MPQLLRQFICRVALKRHRVVLLSSLEPVVVVVVVGDHQDSACGPTFSSQPQPRGFSPAPLPGPT